MQDDARGTTHPAMHRPHLVHQRPDCPCTSLRLHGAHTVCPVDLTMLPALRRLDPETRMHLRRVCRLAGELASFLGLPPAAQRQAATAGLLHDIGKSLVPGAILHKPAALTPAEIEVLRYHPVDGQALACSTGDPVVLDPEMVETLVLLQTAVLLPAA